MNTHTIRNAVFSALRGCLVEIDGWQADVSTKLSLLNRGLCNVYAMETEFETNAERLMSAFVEEWDIRGCDDPILVDLAMRYFDWSNDASQAPWPDTLIEPEADPLDAFDAGTRWIRRKASEEAGDDVIVFSERRDLQWQHLMIRRASETVSKSLAEGKVFPPLFPPE